MDRSHIFAGVAMIALFNGLFSPALALVIALMPVWMPEFVSPSWPMVLFASALITAFGTLLISGIPAAIYERLAGTNETTHTSLYIWLGTVVLISLPALQIVIAVS
ncbi:MAG: hypothetical protein HQL38_16435 [Alphaproteobacteria bacterium]|nr:hypothetical protein [Alphaproteobacteria bacterium]